MRIVSIELARAHLLRSHSDEEGGAEDCIPVAGDGDVLRPEDVAERAKTSTGRATAQKSLCCNSPLHRLREGNGGEQACPAA